MALHGTGLKYRFLSSLDLGWAYEFLDLALSVLAFLIICCTTGLECTLSFALDFTAVGRSVLLFWYINVE